MTEETRTPAGIAPDGSVVFHPKFAPDDVVRVIGVLPGTMIESYLGSEGRVLYKHPDAPLYMVELDVGRANLDRGGQLGPRFPIKEEHLLPEVTEKMIEAGLKAFRDYEGSLPADGTNDIPPTGRLMTDIYRAMRAARFEQ